MSSNERAYIMNEKYTASRIFEFMCAVDEDTTCLHFNFYFSSKEYDHSQMCQRLKSKREKLKDLTQLSKSVKKLQGPNGYA